MRVFYSVGSFAPARRQLRLVKQRVTRSIANDFYTGVKSRTPVKTGAAKRSWTIKRNGDNYTIANRKKYIVFLDQGSSRQAPEGMTRPTIRALRARGKLK